MCFRSCVAKRILFDVLDTKGPMDGGFGGCGSCLGSRRASAEVGVAPHYEEASPLEHT